MDAQHFQKNQSQWNNSLVKTRGRETRKAREREIEIERVQEKERDRGGKEYLVKDIVKKRKGRLVRRCYEAKDGEDGFLFPLGKGMGNLNEYKGFKIGI